MAGHVPAGMTAGPSGQGLNPLDYYNPEASAFQHIAVRFRETGMIEPAALYLLLDWKAPRARTRHLARLASIADGDFESAVRTLSAELRSASSPREKLELLLGPKWSFRLPTATAILAILYPDDFTVYDVRVCESLGMFRHLGDVSRRNVWIEYEQFIDRVRATAPAGLSLRDCDRWHWGQSKQRALLAELSDSRIKKVNRPE